MLKVGIIGSCVTRDAFEVTNNVYDVKGAYFPRASLISLMSKEVELPLIHIFGTCISTKTTNHLLPLLPCPHRPPASHFPHPAPPS
ncbi:DUF6270 domain-containing protein, partial [Escherichia coli]|uniref:DUF6270 domain-containing protein n=1 Tax=Escherichia coli TaxID=562 RepID=UPI001BFC1F1F